jgi:hypothetical protein
VPHPSLIGRLEALQQQAVSGHDIVDAICVPGAVPMDAAATWIRADALDPILAELRRLQTPRKDRR